MKRVLRFCTIICALHFSAQTFAQNDIDVSHYMFDEISYNPAFTGEGETFRASILGRKQWLGFNGSPLLQTFSIDGATKRLGGLGLHIVNDKIGFENFVTATFNYSYGVNLGKSSRLTAGFAAGIIDRYINTADLVYQDLSQSDPEGYYENTNNIIPTVNVGLNLMIKNFTAGFSATHIATSLNKSSVTKIPRHMYGYLRYRFNPEGKISVVPTVLVKQGSAKLQLEGNANVYFNNKFWIGASYRANESAVGLIGLIIKNRIYIGYSYDFSVGEQRRYSYGSHEVFLSWRMKKDPKQQGFYQSTRLFN